MNVVTHAIFLRKTREVMAPALKQSRADLFVEIVPSVMGLATIHDRDILIYCISQLIASANEGNSTF